MSKRAKKRLSKNQHTKKQWKQMSPERRALSMALAAAQISLAVTAWIDLARRPAHQVNGKKSIWAGIIGINYVGPIAYFLKGRRTD
ncbi:PLD nuclease N-terminal domain-containing protein [Nesterenkonia sandarakina]|uniref:Cardiolipin synthase N-terminal domain-containing protein n=1 Tax=Nesterenkonia sandarakina TaxID=272918 RepID=A0A7Z0J3R4_9MICC|nr:PLD nuclease N-terminal domain-containing protein [Nesterenkonia sandarakina]NYJ17647.1 hypothetical protein [Nesterenkonia sandarakina]